MGAIRLLISAEMLSSVCLDEDNELSSDRSLDGGIRRQSRLAADPDIPHTGVDLSELPIDTFVAARRETGLG